MITNILSNTTEQVCLHIYKGGFAYSLPNETQIFVPCTFDEKEKLNQQKYRERLQFELSQIPNIFTHPVQLIFSNAQFTLIPITYFNESQTSDYLEFNAYIDPNDLINNTTIMNKTIEFVYAYDENIENVLKSLFINQPIEIQHSGPILIEKLAPKGNEPLWVIYLHQESLEIIYFNENKLIIYNYFEIESPEDIIYFNTVVAEQIGVDFSTLPIKIAGLYSQHTEAIELLKKYHEQPIFI